MKISPFIIILSLLILIINPDVNAASKGGKGKGGNGSEKANKSPVIRISYDTLVNGNDLIILDASRSQDRDGFISSYSWFSSDSNMTIEGSSTAIATAVAPNENSQITFTLVVADNLGATSTMSVNVDVQGVLTDEPSALIQPTVTLVRNGTDIQVSWNEANGISYRVLYWQEGSRPSERVTSTNVLTIQGLLSGTYNVLVEAYDTSGNSIFSQPLQI